VRNNCSADLNAGKIKELEGTGMCLGSHKTAISVIFRIHGENEMQSSRGIMMAKVVFLNG
jgi:hypothetical protein